MRKKRDLMGVWIGSWDMKAGNQEIEWERDWGVEKKEINPERLERNPERLGRGDTRAGRQEIETVCAKLIETEERVLIEIGGSAYGTQGQEQTLLNCTLFRNCCFTNYGLERHPPLGLDSLYLSPFFPRGTFPLRSLLEPSPPFFFFGSPFICYFWG